MKGLTTKQVLATVVQRYFPRLAALAAFLSVLSTRLDGGPLDQPRADLICVSNEISGDVTIVAGADSKVIATIPVGKRPRGLHPSPDGRFLYVALSGSPIAGPPKLDAAGVPIQRPDDDDDENADRGADGIGVIDLKALRFVKKLAAGSDPEEFAVSADGTKLYVSNEDVGTVSVVRIADDVVEQIVRVKKEPEGVALSPDGRRVYVTCETGGEVVVIDGATNKAIAEFTVGGRPRTIAFSPDGARAFIPSETGGSITVVETADRALVRKIALPVGSRPMGTAMSGDGKQLYVSNGRAGTVSIIDPSTGTVLKTIAVGKRPWGLGLTRDGGRLYVADGPSNEVAVVDLRADEPGVGRIQAGQGPWGIAVVLDPR